MKVLLILFYLCTWQTCFAQLYPPPAGMPGSTALYKDSSIFVNWASACTVQRGYQDISNPGLGLATSGDSSAVIGKAGLNGVLSLGDGGWAICTFPLPIKNGPGFDFAVFENAFDNSFLELAFVEVSSDGIQFFPFPSHSLTDTLVQIGSFDPLDATKLNNLAGKYRANYGTPFDLQELVGTAGLDPDHITHIKIQDVLGSLQTAYCQRDAYNNKINEPWPTPFPSSGFDLDAIGVIHQNLSASIREGAEEMPECTIYPNPVNSASVVHLNSGLQIKQVELIGVAGSILNLSVQENEIVLPPLQAGLYLLRLITPGRSLCKKLIIQ